MISKHHRRLAEGIGLMILGMASFAAMNVLIRLASTEIETPQLVFLRNAFSVVLLLPLVAWQGSPVLRTRRLGGHFWRAFIGVFSMHLWFYSLSVLPITQATALSFTTPLFVTAFALLFLGEKAGWRRWSALCIGFAGALLIIRPGMGSVAPETGIVLVASALMAVAAILVKTLTRTEKPLAIITYMAFFMTLFSLPLGLWHWKMPSETALLHVLGIAFFSTFAHSCLVHAYTRADMVVLMPFDFTRLIFISLMLSFIPGLPGETLDMFTIAGAALIVASAAYITYRETLRRPVTGPLFDPALIKE